MLSLHRGALLFAIAFVLSACTYIGTASSLSKESNTPQTDLETNFASSDNKTDFRSDKYYVSAEVPSGWAVTEGPATFFHYYEGQLAFTSWGEEGFWTNQEPNGDSIRDVGTLVHTALVPSGGAYLALIRIVGPGPQLPPYNTPEYEPDDLMQLLSTHDWRNESGSETWIPFYKWGRFLQLQVYCDKNAGDETLDQLNRLLESWRFDTVPVGDPEWASLQARKILPRDAKSDWFPIRPGSMDEQGISRTTEEAGENDVVHIKFTVSWGKASYPPTDYAYSSKHWWRIDVLPTGKAVMIAEGGDRLPGSLNTWWKTLWPIPVACLAALAFSFFLLVRSRKRTPTSN